MIIEKLDELNSFISGYIDGNYQCILTLKDNKSNIILQHIVVKHPLDFVRNLNDFSKNLHLPVLDLDIIISGFISNTLTLKEVSDPIIISPYVYFKKPEEVNIDVGSDDSSPSVES